MKNRKTGFTLTEMLIVMGIIILFITMAVPSIRSLSGSGSIGSAQNQISALVGRAREEAIGLQQVRGILFYVDPVSDRVIGALVQATPVQSNDAAQVYVDLVPNRDFLALPSGVRAQTILGTGTFTGSGANMTRVTDGYLGFNKPTANALAKMGGLILFDGNGRLVSQTYGFRCSSYNAAGAPVSPPTAMGQFLGLTTDAVFLSGRAYSSYGLILFDGNTFKGLGYSDEDPLYTSNYSGYTSTYAAGGSTQSEQLEEQWLDQNATPVFINRYNGTLIRAE